MTLRSLVPVITTASNGEELSKGEIFDILSNRRRRLIVRALVHADEPMDMSELSTFVTAWHLGIDPADVEDEDRRNVYSTLRRTHLPKMEAKELVTVDEGNNTVEPTPTLQDLDIDVEVLEGWETPGRSTTWDSPAQPPCSCLRSRRVRPALRASNRLTSVSSLSELSACRRSHHMLDRRARIGNTEKPHKTRNMHERRHPDSTAPRE